MASADLLPPGPLKAIFNTSVALYSSIRELNAEAVLENTSAVLIHHFASSPRSLAARDEPVCALALYHSVSRGSSIPQEIPRDIQPKFTGVQLQAVTELITFPVLVSPHDQSRVKEEERTFSPDCFGSEARFQRHGPLERKQIVFWDTAQYIYTSASTVYTEAPEKIFSPLGFEAQYSAGIQLQFLCCSVSTRFPPRFLSLNPYSRGVFCSRDPIYSVQQGCEAGFM